MGLTFDVHSPATGRTDRRRSRPRRGGRRRRWWRQRGGSPRLAPALGQRTDRHARGGRPPRRTVTPTSWRTSMPSGTGNPVQATRRDVDDGRRRAASHGPAGPPARRPDAPTVADARRLRRCASRSASSPASSRSTTRCSSPSRRSPHPLLTGNCVILKPSPVGAVGAVHGRPSCWPPCCRRPCCRWPPTAMAPPDRRSCGHPRVKRIAFTGSAATAQRIMAEGAAHGIKSFSFELGGKNPLDHPARRRSRGGRRTRRSPA